MTQDRIIYSTWPKTESATSRRVRRREATTTDRALTRALRIIGRVNIAIILFGYVAMCLHVGGVEGLAAGLVTTAAAWWHETRGKDNG